MTDEEQNKHLALWDSVSTTAQAFTKKATVSGQKITAINGTYMIKMATEVWGPIGVNWGYNIVEERNDTGGTVFDNEKNILGNTITHTIKLELWVRKITLDPAWIGHPSEDPIARVYHYGHTPLIYWSTKGQYWVTDNEASKKSLTDALKKCLSMFGFCSDIYLGLYDDFAYVELIKKQQAIDESDDKVQEAIDQRQKWEDWKLSNIKLIQTSVNLNELEKLYVACIRRSEREEDREFKKKVIRATNQRKSELEKKTNDTTTVPNNTSGHGTEEPGGRGPGDGDSGSGHAGSDRDGVRGQGGRGGQDLPESEGGRGGDQKGDSPAPGPKKSRRKSASKPG